MKKPAVSVIVPVYNVEAYIDTCMESIVNQTFSDIEILLINDGSTDASYNKCKEWQLKDDRVIVFSKENEGPGETRNFGVRHAQGKYIVFIDSDDYVDIQYVEKLYKEITSSNADFAECSYYRIRQFSDVKEYVPCTHILGEDLGIWGRLLIGQSASWKIMTTRELWVENDIRQPALPIEDVAVYLLLLCYAKKVVGIDEGLYFYRRGRTSAISSKMDSYRQVSESIEWMVNEFKRRNLFTQYKCQLDAYIRKWISGWMNRCLTLFDKKDYEDCWKAYNTTYFKIFDRHLKTESLLGGFNLSRIINKMGFIENPYNRFNFISIISLVQTYKLDIYINHYNTYRKIMLEREYGRKFWELLNENKTDYFFFDLLEERHHILKYSGMYFTMSDAFEEARILENGMYSVIERDSIECEILWEECFSLFIKKLESYYPMKNIIMVENYLTESYGNGECIKNYNNIEYIKKTNNVLKKYYDFVRYNYKDIQIIEAYKEKNYYTDIQYTFGCYPWHLNELTNLRIAKRIQKELIEI